MKMLKDLKYRIDDIRLMLDDDTFVPMVEVTVKIALSNDEMTDMVSDEIQGLLVDFIAECRKFYGDGVSGDENGSV